MPITRGTKVQCPWKVQPLMLASLQCGIDPKSGVSPSLRYCTQTSAIPLFRATCCLVPSSE